jgi:hypothetical protein
MDNGDDLTREEIVEWHKIVAKKAGWDTHGLLSMAAPDGTQPKGISTFVN